MPTVDDVRHQRLYLAQALVLGVPAVLAGGGLAILAIWAFFTRRTYMGASEGPLLLIWSVAGLCGLLAWLWLSGVYLRRGRSGLRHAGALAWAGLGLGMLGALGVAGFIAFALVNGSPWQVLGYLVFGPLLLFPSAHLVWLARGQMR
ncbi:MULTISPECIES: hypothetical protein [unclassified Stenotrophomonas]|uniref:hypothetical protein n=1 Tax=unclassified Stenotrophomonas TaxID=196198 RepID=UPI002119731B|nr:MULTISPECIES: hypothetical protein [unclassified Stenotrophomonas]